MSTRKCALIAAFLLTAGLAVVAQPATTAPQQKGGEGVSGPYEVVANWPQPVSSDLTWGRTSFIYAESPDRVFVIQSGLVPWSWKKLQGEQLAGARASGGTQIRNAAFATHC